MDALSVISLADAKNHLVVLNDDFYDKQITGIIRTAVNMIEQYTGYYFYPVTKSYQITSSKTEITDFPLAITGITDATGQPVSSFNVGISQGALATYVNYWQYSDCANGNASIQANVGYNDPTDIPYQLIGACYKLITYLFENKDIYTATLPVDIQLMCNQLRRSCSI